MDQLSTIGSAPGGAVRSDGGSGRSTLLVARPVVLTVVVGAGLTTTTAGSTSTLLDRGRSAHYRQRPELPALCPASPSVAGRGRGREVRGDGDMLRILLLVVNMLLIQRLVLLGLLVVVVVEAADLVIRIPGDLSQQDGFYRLDYRCTGWAGREGVKGVLRVAPSSKSCYSLVCIFKRFLNLFFFFGIKSCIGYSCLTPPHYLIRAGW